MPGRSGPLRRVRSTASMPSTLGPTPEFLDAPRMPSLPCAFRRTESQVSYPGEAAPRHDPNSDGGAGFKDRAVKALMGCLGFLQLRNPALDGALWRPSAASPGSMAWAKPHGAVAPALTARGCAGRKKADMGKPCPLTLGGV